jgi:hypothetical protein
MFTIIGFLHHKKPKNHRNISKMKKYAVFVSLKCEKSPFSNGLGAFAAFWFPKTIKI